MNPERHRYASYLLRMWLADGPRGWVWCASLESPRDGQRHAFASLEHLIAFLQAQAAAPRPIDPGGDPDEGGGDE